MAVAPPPVTARAFPGPHSLSRYPPPLLCLRIALPLSHSLCPSFSMCVHDCESFTCVSVHLVGKYLSHVLVLFKVGTSATHLGCASALPLACHFAIDAGFAIYCTSASEITSHVVSQNPSDVSKHLVCVQEGKLVFPLFFPHLFLKYKLQYVQFN